MLRASYAFLPTAPGRRSFLTRIHSSRPPGGKSSYAPTNASWKTSNRKVGYVPGSLKPDPKNDLDNGTVGNIFGFAVALALALAITVGSLDAQGALPAYWKNYYDDVIMRVQSTQAIFAEKTSFKSTEAVKANEHVVAKEADTPPTTIESKQGPVESKTESSSETTSSQLTEAVKAREPVAEKEEEATIESKETAIESKKESSSMAEKALAIVNQAAASLSSRAEPEKNEPAKLKLDPNDIPWGEYSAEWVEAVSSKQ